MLAVDSVPRATEDSDRWYTQSSWRLDVQSWRRRWSLSGLTHDWGCVLEVVSPLRWTAGIATRLALADLGSDGEHGTGSDSPGAKGVRGLRTGGCGDTLGAGGGDRGGAGNCGQCGVCR